MRLEWESVTETDHEGVPFAPLLVGRSSDRLVVELDAPFEAGIVRSTGEPVFGGSLDGYTARASGPDGTAYGFRSYASVGEDCGGICFYAFEKVEEARNGEPPEHDEFVLELLESDDDGTETVVGSSRFSLERRFR